MPNLTATLQRSGLCDYQGYKCGCTDNVTGARVRVAGLPAGVYGPPLSRQVLDTGASIH